MSAPDKQRFTFRDLLWFLSLPLGMILLGSLLLWDFGDKLPLFDAQGHYDPEVWRRAPPAAVINTLEELGVIGMVVSSTGNEGVDQLQDFGAELVLPMLSLYTQREQRDTWLQDPSALARLDEGLRRSDYVGVGEVHLYDGQVRGAVVEGLVARVAERGLILNAHADARAIEQLYAMNPSLRILWAHAGMTARPEAIGRMLARYPQLLVELSHRRDVAPRGELSPDWRALLIRHPQRFMIGSGTYNSEYWYQFRYTMGAYRDWLQTLPREVAEMIAYRNGLRVFRGETGFASRYR